MVPDEFHVLKYFLHARVTYAHTTCAHATGAPRYRATLTRIRGLLRHKGLMLLDAFRAFDYDRNGLLSCEELYGQQTLIRTRTPLARQESVQLSGNPQRTNHTPHRQVA